MKWKHDCVCPHCTLLAIRINFPHVISSASRQKSKGDVPRSTTWINGTWWTYKISFSVFGCMQELSSQVESSWKSPLLIVGLGNLLDETCEDPRSLSENFTEVTWFENSCIQTASNSPFVRIVSSCRLPWVWADAGLETSEIIKCFVCVCIWTTFHSLVNWLFFKISQGKKKNGLWICKAQMTETPVKVKKSS